MSDNVIKPAKEESSVVKEQKYNAADAVRSPIDYTPAIKTADYTPTVAAEQYEVQTDGGDGQQRIEQQRRDNERYDSVKFDNDIDLDKERSREQLGYRDYHYPTYQAERYRPEDIEKTVVKEARYGTVEREIANTVIKADVAAAAAAAVIKNDLGDTIKADVIKPAQSAVLAEQVKQTAGEAAAKDGLLKTVGGIAIREVVAEIGHGGDTLSEKVKGQTVKYGYKAGKYAALSTVAVTRGTYGLAKEAAKQHKELKASNNSPLKKKAANKVIKDKAKTSLAASGASIKKIIKTEATQAIEDFHGSDDLGVKALTAPKDIYVKTKRTISTVKATGKAARTVAKGTAKAAKAAANGVKTVAAGAKNLILKVLGSKVGLIVAAVVLIAVLVVALIDALVPNITLKSDNKELTRTYEYVTELDANLTDTIRSIPESAAGRGIDEFHFYVNGYETSAENITILTNADYLLMLFDVKYDDYAFDKFIYGIFGGTNVKDEVKALHNTLYSYTTNKWKEEIEHEVTGINEETGEEETTTWVETIWHLDINVNVQNLEQYVSNNIVTLLSDDEQERFNVMREVGAYTAHVELGRPFEDAYYITSRWGWRISPISGDVSLHNGIDIGKEAGTPIMNVLTGTVSFVGYDATGYGNYCTVTSANGEKEVLYAHMQSVAVAQGQLVNKGDIVGYVGSTGASTGNHLHLEYSIENGFKTNPAFFLDGASYTGFGSNDIVAAAASQLGNVGGQPYWSWYGFGGRVEWCACFVSWCAEQCGYIDAGLIPKYAGCITGSDWFKRNNIWQYGGGGYTPKTGDIIFFDWIDDETGVQDGLSDHTGIVESCDGSYVYTIEGNSGNACRRNTYSLYSIEIYGYGTPAYPAE